MLHHKPSLSMAESWRQVSLILLGGAYLILLPFSRSAEIALLILALAGPVCWWKNRHKPVFRRAVHYLTLLFIAFALPLLISSLDSYEPQKSWLQSIASLRFYLASITLLVIFSNVARQQKLLRLLAAVILFWALDACVQFLIGYNLLGYTASTERLGGVFGDNIWFFGPTLAMLSPLALEWLWRQSRRWLTIVGFVLIAAAILLSGMRAGWLLLPVIGLFYAWRLVRQYGRQSWRMLLSATLIVGILSAVIVHQSPIVQQRIQQSLSTDITDDDALQRGLSERWLIWQASIDMIQMHPINGVGVRAFPEAYPEFTNADDPQLIKHGGDRGARHAHNVWLEAVTDCGLFGLLGLLVMVWLGFRIWCSATAAQRYLALPYLFSVLLIMFPFNTHFSLYGTFLSSTLWWLIGLGMAALFISPQTDSGDELT